MKSTKQIRSNIEESWMMKFRKKFMAWDVKNQTYLDLIPPDISPADILTFIQTLLTSEVEKERELIKQAFIKEYRGSGEVWFPYESEGNCTKEEEQKATEDEWDSVMEQYKALVTNHSQEK